MTAAIALATVLATATATAPRVNLVEVGKGYSVADAVMDAGAMDKESFLDEVRHNDQFRSIIKAVTRHTKYHNKLKKVLAALDVSDEELHVLLVKPKLGKTPKAEKSPLPETRVVIQGARGPYLRVPPSAGFEAEGRVYAIERGEDGSITLRPTDVVKKSKRIARIEKRNEAAAEPLAIESNKAAEPAA